MKEVEEERRKLVRNVPSIGNVIEGGNKALDKKCSC
jgi:hypothetical protein